MQRAREQQEAQHAMQQGEIEVDGGKERLSTLFNGAEAQRMADDHRQRRQQCQHQHTDVRRQLYETMIHVGQHRSQRNHDGDSVEYLDVHQWRSVG